MKLSKLDSKRIFDFVITRAGVLDKENDIVPEEEIGEALDGWLMRDAPISDLHSNRIVGKGLRWYQAADGRIMARGVIHEDSRVSDDVWEKIKSGEYASVSIGGAAFDKSPNGFGGNNLNGLEILEVAVCPKGMHQDANILDKNDLAKSFILKAEIDAIIKPSTTVTAVEEISLNEKPILGGITMDIVNKEVPAAVPDAPGGNSLEAIMQAIVALQAEVAQLKQSMAPPAPAPVAVEQAMPAASSVEPPKDDQYKKADVEALVQKKFDELKTTVVKSTTPLPPVDTGVQKKAVEYPALAIARGEKKLGDFIKSNDIAKLERQIAMRKEFEAFEKSRGVKA